MKRATSKKSMLRRLMLTGCALVAMSSVTAAQELADRETLLDVSKVTTNTRQLGNGAIEQLAESMIVEQRGVKALNAVLARFYALNAIDAERVMKAMRERVYDAELTRLEPDIARAISELNAHSMSTHGIPFHLALARGLSLPAEEIFAKANLAAAFGGSPQQAQAAPPCPSSSHPRRISWTGKVNRLQYAWSYKSWADPALGSTCHARHGSFSKTIQEWNSYNPSMICLAQGQQYGGKMAADANNFLYKWWTLIPCSVTSSLILGAMRSRY